MFINKESTNRFAAILSSFGNKIAPSYLAEANKQIRPITEKNVPKDQTLQENTFEIITGKLQLR